MHIVTLAEKENPNDFILKTTASFRSFLDEAVIIGQIFLNFYVKLVIFSLALLSNTYS